MQSLMQCRSIELFQKCVHETALPQTDNSEYGVCFMGCPQHKPLQRPRDPTGGCGQQRTCVALAEACIHLFH
jgi:hypothetical protein